MLTPTPAIIGAGMGDSVALLTDGRFSGGGHGFCIGRIALEAQLGGPIALVENGDPSRIDARPSQRKNGRDVVQHGDHRHCVSYKEPCSNTCRVWRQPMRDGRSVDWARLAAAAAKTPAVGRTGETHCRTRIASQICCDISQIHLCFVSCTEKLQTQLLMNPNCCLLQLFSLA